MTKPRIFVSSTILDFEDLRSSLKYYLEEYNYDVQMSEYPDFDVPLDSSTFDSCINNLKSCNYFILLIGYRRGSWYKKDIVSITHQEYKTAKSLIESGHPLRIISFVRQPLFLLKKEHDAFHNHLNDYGIKLKGSLPSSIIDDPEYIFQFINEVSEGVKFPGSDSPSNNWMYDFTSFKDIIVALKHTFQISESLDNKRIKSLFLRELKQNMKKFEIPKTGIDTSGFTNPSEFPMVNLFQIVADRFCKYVIDENGYLKNIGKNISFPGAELIWLLTYSFILPIQNILIKLQTRILKRVIDEGIYLLFDIKSDSFKPNYLIDVLEKLLDMSETFTNYQSTPSHSEFVKDLGKKVSDGSGELKTFTIPTSIGLEIMMQSDAARIYDIIKAIIAYIENGNVKLLKELDLSKHYIKRYYVSE